jgi:hypothetical protein
MYVREVSPGVFEPWRGGEVVKICRTATRIVRYEDGNVDQEDIEVEPYETRLKLPAKISAAWSAEELAAMGLYKVEPFTVPDGKQATGPARYEKRDGAVFEVRDLEDIPPAPEPQPSPLDDMRTDLETLSKRIAALEGGRQA